MAEIIRTFRESIPNMRFIGKKYDNFGHWGEWWQNGWFDKLESAMGGTDKILTIWENGGGYIGLERRCEGKPFEYYIGMMTPRETEVPDDFISIDFENLELGTCWIYGSEKEVHKNTHQCIAKLIENEMSVWRDSEGYAWSFENCLCPRYTTPDKKGNVILDYCYFVI